MTIDVKEYAELEEEIEEELYCAIGDLSDDEAGSRVRDVQPPDAVVRAMAKAATQVLIAFEHGYRLGG